MELERSGEWTLADDTVTITLNFDDGAVDTGTVRSLASDAHRITIVWFGVPWIFYTFPAI